MSLSRRIPSKWSLLVSLADQVLLLCAGSFSYRYFMTVLLQVQFINDLFALYQALPKALRGHWLICSLFLQHLDVVQLIPLKTCKALKSHCHSELENAPSTQSIFSFIYPLTGQCTHNSVCKMISVTLSKSSILFNYTESNKYFTKCPIRTAKHPDVHLYSVICALVNLLYYKIHNLTFSSYFSQLRIKIQNLARILAFIFNVFFTALQPSGFKKLDFNSTDIPLQPHQNKREHLIYLCSLLGVFSLLVLL